MAKKIHTILITGLLALSGFGGYSLGVSKNSSQSFTPKPSVEQNIEQNMVKISPLFTTQIASIQGQIIEYSNTSLTVTDKNGHQEAFPISEKFVIYKPLKGNPAQASASSDLSLIETNTNVLIMLEYIDNKYQVVSISNLPEITPLR